MTLREYFTIILAQILKLMTPEDNFNLLKKQTRLWDLLNCGSVDEAKTQTCQLSILPDSEHPLWQPQIVD